MAGVTENPASNRKSRRAAAATGAAAPAIAASAERAAIESVVDPATTTLATTDLATAAPQTDTFVAPEPTIVANPGEPLPIITASPVLATEVSAIDVVQAEAADMRAAAGIGPAPDRDPAHAVVTGQTTLAIEGWGAARIARALAESIPGAEGALVLDPAQRETMAIGLMADVVEALELIRTFATHRFDEIGERVFGIGHSPAHPTPADLVQILRELKANDEEAFDLVFERTFDAEDLVLDRAVRGPTVTVVEVIGPAQGRRRAGLSFGPAARHFRLDDLTAEQLLALKADPMLAVGMVAIPEADAEALPALG